MKILKTYKTENGKKSAYGTNSKLLTEIRKLYDLDEVVLGENYDEEEYAELIRKYDVLLTMWGSVNVPDSLADNPGNLKYICNITGSVRRWISEKIAASPHITLTNWGDAPAFGIAEGAFSLMLTMLKDIPYFIDCARKNLNRPGTDTRRVGTLFNTRIGIYGLGVIGRKFVEMLRPFMPEIFVYDPYVDDMPDGVTKVNTKEELFSKAQILVVHAALCEETKGSITKELLAMLPDGALFINTARGGIVDEQALIDEILSGRIRAGLDVMDYTINPTNGDMPAIDDPVRQVSNAVFTGHHISDDAWSKNPDRFDFTEINCLENLRRFSNGEPLRFVMDIERYRKST